MRRLLILTLLVLPGVMPQRGTDLDPVLKRAKAYVATYENQLSTIIATEDFLQKTTRLAPARGTDKKTERKAASDILMVRDGNEWFPVRCVRSADDVVTDQEAYARKDAIAALGARPEPTSVRRSFNLPTVALAVLHESNASRFSFSKHGEEHIDGKIAWKVGFEEKSPRPGSVSVAGTLWIRPETGQILRTQMEEGTTDKSAGDYQSRVSVQYTLNSRFQILTPISMQEHYEDSYVTLDGNADYKYIPRPGASSVQSSPKAETGKAGPSEYKIAVDVPLVTLDVSVGGDRGAVTDLKADDFTVYENGTAQKIAHFTPVSVPFDVLLLFDWSKSVAEKRMFLQQAATGFIDHLRSQDWIGIGRFSTEVEMEGWTASKSEAARSVAQLRSELPAGTNLYASLEAALTNETLPFVGRRRAMVVLTDGRDNAFENVFLAHKINPAMAADSALPEKERFSRLLDLLRQERIPLYLVGVDTPVDMGAEFARSDSVKAEYIKSLHERIQQIADASGGRALFPKRFEDIVPLYQQIGQELGTAYTLGYYSNLPGDPGYRQITVKTRDGSLKVLQSRAGYEIRN